MKKKLLVVMALSLSLILAGCGTSANENTAENNQDNDQVKVEKEVFNVEITLPKDLSGDITQAELDKEINEEHVHSATLNDDGSVTYVMSKRQHKEMMEEIVTGINESLNKMIGSEEFPNIVKIEADENFSHFKVTTKSNELSIAESFSVLAFYMYSGLYNTFNGTAGITCYIDFINGETGEIYESSNSNELIEE